MLRTGIVIALMLIGSGTAWADGNSGAPDEELRIRPLKTFRTEREAQAFCDKDPVIWADRYAGYYYWKRNKEYGRTSEGAYACWHSAEKSNYWDTSPMAGIARGHGPGRVFPFTPFPQPFVGS